MAYFSDVCFATTKEGFDMLKTNKRIKELLSEADSIKFNTEDNCVLVWWKTFKWYDTVPEFPEYDFMCFLPELEEKDIPYCFVRMGEEFGDVETQSYRVHETNFPDIYPVQRIEIYPEDWDGEQIEI